MVADGQFRSQRGHDRATWHRIPFLHFFHVHNVAVGTRGEGQVPATRIAEDRHTSVLPHLTEAHQHGLESRGLRTFQEERHSNLAQDERSQRCFARTFPEHLGTCADNSNGLVFAHDGARLQQRLEGDDGASDRSTNEKQTGTVSELSHTVALLHCVVHLGLPHLKESGVPSGNGNFILHDRNVWQGQRFLHTGNTFAAQDGVILGL
mmetsp:Transcript_53779/g.143959  ORF Transcript_53779/g.143959 Transcript_53779/m.143959 type:complete len:207 (+) Transcript_53779:1946-2566(+)